MLKSVLSYCNIYVICISLAFHHVWDGRLPQIPTARAFVKQYDHRYNKNAETNIKIICPGDRGLGALAVSLTQHLLSVRYCRPLLQCDTMMLSHDQELKYNFQGAGTVQLSGPPSLFPGPHSFPGPMFQ